MSFDAHPYGSERKRAVLASHLGILVGQVSSSGLLSYRERWCGANCWYGAHRICWGIRHPSAFCSLQAPKVLSTPLLWYSGGHNT